MGINQTYAVFGLGRYGRSVAKELAENGAEVVAVDNREAVVNAAISEIPYCKCADVTDPEALRQIGIANIDVVIVTMANHLEASVMATMLCKELGVKTVIAKCATEINCKILTKVGADRVVFPESESGIHLAKNLLSSGSWTLSNCPRMCLWWNGSQTAVDREEPDRAESAEKIFH